MDGDVGGAVGDAVGGALGKSSPGQSGPGQLGVGPNCPPLNENGGDVGGDVV